MFSILNNYIIKKTESFFWLIGLFFHNTVCCNWNSFLFLSTWGSTVCCNWNSFLFLSTWGSLLFIFFIIFISCTKSNTTCHSSISKCYTGYFSSPAKATILTTSWSTWVTSITLRVTWVTSITLRVFCILRCLSCKTSWKWCFTCIINKSLRINKHILDLWWGSSGKWSWGKFICYCGFSLSNFREVHAWLLTTLKTLCSTVHSRLSRQYLTL